MFCVVVGTNGARSRPRQATRSKKTSPKYEWHGNDDECTHRTAITFANLEPNEESQEDDDK